MISVEKLNKLESVNATLNNKYGEKGSASRAEFDAKTQAWYLRDERKKRRITAKSLDDNCEYSTSTNSLIT